MKYVVCITLGLLFSSISYSQYNLSPKDKYLANPYITLSQERFDEVVIKKAGNRPPDYFSVKEDGYVILLDSTVIYGDISIYGRCYNDTYGVIMTSEDTVSDKWFARSSYYNFNRSSLLAWGLKDRSVNETPQRFEWKEKFPVYEYNQDYKTVNALDTARYLNFIDKVFSIKRKSDKDPIFVKLDIEESEPDYGYLIKTDGTKLEGYLHLNKVEGVITDIRISKDVGIGNRPPEGLRTFQPEEIKAYGLNEKKVYDGKLNETPSAFKWGMQMPNSTQRSTKKEQGYIELPDGRVLQGRLEIIAENDEATKVRFKEDGGRNNFYPLDRITRFGLDNAPKDKSINETPDEFRFKMKFQLGGENPAILTSYKKVGYLETQEGNLYEGYLTIDKEYGFITLLEIKTNKEGKLEFLPHQVKRYGLNSGKPENQPVVIKEYGDDVMQEAASHMLSSYIKTVPYAENEAKSEVSQKFYQWVLVGGSPGKFTEKSAEAEGYVILKNGKRVEGDLEIKRLNTKEEKYKLKEFKVKNDDGKNKFDPEQVQAYGLIGVESGIEKIKPGDKVGGYIVAKNPKVIKSPTNFGGYKTEPKAGYIQSADGNVKIGLVSVRKTSQSRMDVTIEDFEGNEQEFKGVLLSYGFFDIQPFSEFPSSVYQRNTPGYIELLNGETIRGDFRGDLINIGEDETEELYDENLDPCTQQNINTPPASVFIEGLEAAEKEEDDKETEYIFTFKLKTDDGIVKYQSDQVRAYGAINVYMNQVNKDGIVVYEDEKRNFHRGTLKTKSGQSLHGWIAHIKREDAENYYGVYYTKSASEPLVVYRMDELSEINQNIIEVQEYDPLEEDFLASKQTSSTFDNSEDAKLIMTDGETKMGNITIEIPEKSWFASSVIFMNANGAQEVFDKDNPLDKIILQDSTNTTYKYYRGVFVEVLLQEGPFYYFRNPFPSVRNSGSKILNWLVDKAMSAGQDALAKAMQSATLRNAENLEQLEAGLKASDAVQNMDAGKLIDFEMFKKEYTVYDEITNRNYIVLPNEIGSFTRYPQYDDLKNGCINYIKLDRKEQKALGDIEDIKTGEGITTSLEYLRNCYYPEM